MHYDEIVRLQEQHPAWALLRSPPAALMLSFFGRVSYARVLAALG